MFQVASHAFLPTSSAASILGEKFDFAILAKSDAAALW